jgi:cytochrome b6
MKSSRFEFIVRRLATLFSVVMLTLSFIGAVTGILLAFYYQPTAGGAYNSLSWITTQIPFGSIIRGIHTIAGNSLIVVSLLQIVVMFLGERFRPSWLTAWISGIFLTLTAIALSWTAMVLDWSQVGYWRFRIELGNLEAIPWIGQGLRDFLTGGGGITTLTVERLYTLHSYILTLGALILAVLHLGGLLLQEREEKRKLLESSFEPEVPS